MAVEGQTTALLNRFTDPKYQRRNWNHLETAIKTAVNGLIPPTVTLTTTELQTLAHSPSAINNPNPTDFLTLISHSINRTSAELLSLNQNLIRGRGVFCKACFEYQRHDHAAFAALVAAVNSNHPQIGHLLLRRLVSDIKEAHNRHNYATLSDLTKFLAHLVNQRVSAESLGFELVNFFLYSGDSPSDAIVMIAVEFVRQCGAALRKADSDDFDGVLDRLRELLQAKRNSSLYGDISDDDSKVKVIVQAITSLRSAEFRNAVRVIPELDVVSEKEQCVTHSDISFYDDKLLIDTERELDSFRFDSEFFDADIARARMEMELIILACEDEPFGDKEAAMQQLGQVVVHDRESETCWLIVELCGQEDMYKPYYADLGRKMHKEFDTGYKPWKQCFIDVYDKIEEFEEKKLENVAKFFGDLMGTKVEWVKRGPTMVIKGDGIPWEYVLGNLRLWHKSNSDAAKTFLKVMFDQVAVRIGTNARSSMINALVSKKNFKMERIFPTSDVKKLRMWINFFNLIGLRTLTQYAKPDKVCDDDFTRGFQ